MKSTAELIAPPRGVPFFAGTSLSPQVVGGIAALVDVLIICVTSAVIYFAYLGAMDSRPGYYETATFILVLITVMGLQVAGAYRFDSIVHPSRSVVHVVGVLLFAFLVLVVSGFALKLAHLYSRVWAFAWLIALAFLVPAGRQAVAIVVRRAAAMGHLSRNILVYGGDRQADTLIEHIRGLSEPWNRVVGVFDDRLARIGNTVAGIPVLGNLDDMIRYGRTYRSDEILVTLPWGAQQRITGIVRQLTSLPVNVRLSPEFAVVDLHRHRASQQFGLPMLNVLEKPISGWSVLTKSLLDLTFGAFFVLVGAPLMALIAICIRLESPGPVLFRQKRYGFNQQLIGVYKFRTMYTHMTDHDADQLTQRRDPRVTRVGAILRRFGLDELPQLFNVLAGDMSVVGPRPHATQAKAGGRLYQDVVDQYAVRHKVKPGITGWAQINGWRGNTDTEESLIKRVEHDLYYIDHWSVLMDLRIILQTFWAVVHGKNSY